MTGWDTFKDNITRTPDTVVKPAPVTLTELAASGQRAQLEQLIDALVAHPDLAARLYVALRHSP